MIYLIVDTAADPRLFGLVTACPEHMCLFAGPLRSAVARNAPYIVEASSAPGLVEAWKTSGSGKPWGLVCRSNRTLMEVRRELRRSLQARLPDGRVVLFRFYDPRVWRPYVESLEPSELLWWFEAASAYYASTGEPARLMEYRFDGERLSATPKDVLALF